MMLSPKNNKTRLAKVSEEGVEFQSHIDGSRHFLRPEDSIAIQEALGSDILMVFDECTPYPADEKEATRSMELSLRWEERSLQKFSRFENALFAIVQGGMYPQLRKECYERLQEISLRFENQNPQKKYSGYAIGGLSVGEPKNLMREMAACCGEMIDSSCPRYLMGVGTPEDLVECIGYGIDMFDCVMPTRHARNGMLFTSTGHIVIKNSQYQDDNNPIDSQCTCYTCKNFSRAYLRHLYLAKEILSSILNTIHNLHYYLDLVGQARSAISENRFLQWKNNFLSQRDKEDL